MTIKVRYSSIDGFSKRRSFKTIKAARAFAVRYVGETPELGSTYAVSFDGIGKVTVTGCTLRELFFDEPAEKSGAFEVWYGVVDEDRGTTRFVKDPNGCFATLREADIYAQHHAEDCDGLRIIATTPEAKAELDAQKARYEAQLAMDRELDRLPYTFPF